MSNLRRSRLRISKRFPYGSSSTPSPVTRGRSSTSTFSVRPTDGLTNDEKKKQISGPLLNQSDGQSLAIKDEESGDSGALSLPLTDDQVSKKPLPSIPTGKRGKRKAPTPPSASSLSSISEISLPPPYAFRNRSFRSSSHALNDESLYLEPDCLPKPFQLTHSQPQDSVYRHGNMTSTLESGGNNMSPRSFPETVTTHMWIFKRLWHQLSVYLYVYMSGYLHITIWASVSFPAQNHIFKNPWSFFRGDRRYYFQISLLP